MRFKYAVRRLFGNTQGAAVIEFAFAFPVLLTLFYGAVEMTRYVLFHEKMESAAIQIVDIINQQSEITITDLNKINSVIPEFMKPFDGSTVTPFVMVVERTRDPGGARCKLKQLWNYGTGMSKIAVDGALPKPNVTADRLPELDVQEGDTVTVMELTGRYRPILDDAFGKNLLGNLTGEVYVRSYSRPRYGAFRCHPATRVCVATPCF